MCLMGEGLGRASLQFSFLISTMDLSIGFGGRGQVVISELRCQ